MLPPHRVVMVTHEDVNAVRLAVRSLLAAGVAPEHVIVVDSGSSVGVRRALRRALPPDVALLEVPNRGYGAAVNSGVAEVTGDAGDYLLVCNHDLVFSKDAVRSLLAAAQSLDASAVVPLIVAGTSATRDRPIWYAGGEVNLRSLRVRHWATVGLSRKTTPRHRNIPFISGACFLVGVTEFNRLGGFDERFFMYSEDVDFSLRFAMQGYRCAFVESAVVAHSLRRASPGPRGEVRTIRWRAHGAVTLLRKHWATVGVRRAWAMLEVLRNLLRLVLRGGDRPESAFTSRAAAAVAGVLDAIGVGPHQAASETEGRFR